MKNEQQRDQKAASSVRETAARRVRQARSDRRGKREDRDSHDEDERVEGGTGYVPEWHYVSRQPDAKVRSRNGGMT